MPAVDGRDSCEATGSRLGLRTGFRIRGQWLPAADPAQLRIGFCVRLRRVRVGTSDADTRRPANGAGGGVAPLPPRIRRFSWLVSALSWLGLLGPRHVGRRADEPLTAALDAGLGPDRRTESGDLWKRPAPGVRPRRSLAWHERCGSTATTRTTATSATGSAAPGTISTSGAGPIWTAADGLPCCCRFPAAPEWWETNADKHIR